MNILELKRSTAGNVFRISEGEEQDSWFNNSLKSTTGLINSKKVEGQKYQVEVGQDEQGRSFYEDQEYKAAAPILKESYAAGEEDQYVKDLSLMTHGGTGEKASSPETGTDTWQGNSTGTQETFTPEQAVEMYNKMDPRLANDPYMASMLGRAGQYYEAEGDFRPGDKRATAQNFQDFLAQDKIDGAKKEKNLKLLAALAFAAVGGVGALAGSATAGGGAAAGTAAGSGGAAAGGAAAGTAAGSGMGAMASGGSGASFLSSPIGKFAVGQGISLGAKALSGAGKDQEQNPGLMNSSQNRPAQQPIVNNYYSGQQQRPAPAPTPRPIASANGSMYSSGSGFGASINKYAQKKSASGG